MSNIHSEIELHFYSFIWHRNISIQFERRILKYLDFFLKMMNTAQLDLIHSDTKIYFILQLKLYDIMQQDIIFVLEIWKNFSYHSIGKRWITILSINHTK